MNVTAEQLVPGHIRLRMEEGITIYNAAALKGELLNALADCSELEIDLSQVNEMDSAGFQLVWALKQEAARLGKTLRMVSHSSAVIDVFDTFNMTNYFGDPVVISSGQSKGKVG